MKASTREIQSSSLSRTFQPTQTIITANRRLSRYLRSQYDKQQHQTGYTTWPSIDILPLKQWIIRTWQSLDDERVLLTDTQELYLWREIITKQASAKLLQPEQAAYLAKQAWEQLQLWGIHYQQVATTNSADVQTFHEWGKTFESRCQQENWITLSALPNELRSYLRVSTIPLPSQFQIIGFDRIPPAIKALLDTIKVTSNVEILIPQHATQDVHRVKAAHVDEEIVLMTRFAKQKWQREPHSSIGCIVPNLTEVRRRITSIFEEVFAPYQPFNISGGERLATYPIIHCALTILGINNQIINYKTLSNLLLSPFIKGGEKEYLNRANLDAAIRDYGEVDINLRMTLALAKQENSNYYCPIWCQQIERFLDLINYTEFVRKDKMRGKNEQEAGAYTRVHEDFEQVFNKADRFSGKFSHVKKLNFPSTWVEFFNEQLSIFGWPGERKLTSEEYQLVQRWQTLYDELASFDMLTQQPISQTSAYQLLRELAKQTVFQTQTPDELPIQVLGALESTGQQFDALWVMGLNVDNWPLKPSPNPFIPIKLQRQAQMPHSSIEQETQYAKLLIQRFCQSSKQVLLSYAQSNETELTEPSPLITNYPELSVNQLPLADWKDPAEALLNSITLETFEDSYAPPLTKDEISHGGTKIFERQATCPFRAFAEIRLGSEKLTTPTYGLAAHERGSIWHDILARIWRGLKGSKQLHTISQATLSALIHKVVNNVLTEQIKYKPLTLQQRFSQIEQKRLTQQVAQWLELEKKRKPFEVFAIEEKQNVKIGGIDIHIRIDRIDLVEDNYLVIDYKTGKTVKIDNFDNYIANPQLAIYSIIQNKPMGGIAFANLQPDRMNFKGVTINKEILPNIKPIDFTTWQALQNTWQVKLTILGEEFKQGYAAVEPRTKGACEHCQLHAFCRIEEKSLNDIE